MPANGHDTFPSAKTFLLPAIPLLCVLKLNCPGGVMHSRFVVTMVTFGAPQASNSDDTWCFRWGWFASRFYVLSASSSALGLPFALHLR